MSGIPTRAFKDPAMLQAAQVIDARFGKKNNREITQEDLVEAQKVYEEVKIGVLDKVEGWHPDEVSVLRRRLPELWKAFNAAEAGNIKLTARFTNIVVDAIANEKIRDTAKVLATLTRPERLEVSITDIIYARSYFKAKRAGTEAEFKDKALAAKIETGLKDGKFDMDAFDLLGVFMTTGNGDLAGHGPMTIGDHVFNDVFWLPRDILDDNDNDDRKNNAHPPRAAHAAAGLESVNATSADEDEDEPADEPPLPARAIRTPPAPPRSRSDSELLRIIEAYELKFAKSGYDRVYIKGADGRLFVALNAKGPVDDIGEGYHVTVGDNDFNVDSVGSGTVMRVVETTNSIGDATVGFWGKLLSKLGATIRGLLNRRTDARLAATEQRVASATKDKMSKDDQENMRNMLISGGAVATMGAAIASAGAVLGQVPLTAGAVVGIGVVTTAVNVVEYLTGNMNFDVYYHASGVTVGAGGPVKPR